jgi:2-octaprenyl-6-methoxyphenol hydroxylase
MDYDVAIVGGGMVGASLALALRGLPLSVLLIEGFAPDSASQPSFDDRTTALGNGTRRIFEALGVWPAMAADAGAIRTIHVSDRGRFGFARLEAAQQGVDAFGYVVANRAIGQALWQALRQPGADALARLELRVPARASDIDVSAACVALTVTPTAAAAAGERCRARLLVAADGAQSGIRDLVGIGAHVEDYGQTALVVNVAADRPNDGTAYERFTPTGPLAVLPLRDGSYTFVWTLAPAAAQAALALDDAAFLATLQRAFGWRAGRLVRAGRRSQYDLALTRADETVATRTVLIGNAAQALHPVAGQGFNLGIRDAATLAEVLAERPGDAGDPTLLASFAARREDDRRGVTRFTDGLVKLFRDERRAVGVARSLGLLLFDLAPPAKNALSRVSWGFAGRAPRLARGLRIR